MHFPTSGLPLVPLVLGRFVGSSGAALSSQRDETKYSVFQPGYHNNEIRHSLWSDRVKGIFTRNSSDPSIPVYTFYAESSQNLAVYFGRTDATLNTNLFNQCNDSNVDIVVLAFVTSIVGGGGYPNLSFDDLCSGQTAKMASLGATGLKLCVDLAAQITRCQALGKKILVSIGGSLGNATFSSTAAATTGATMMWNMFGGGNGIDSSLRPFGDVQVDGFDINNESDIGDYYIDFVKALRSSFKSGKTYYLSASVSCSYPSLSSPLEMLQLVDWVWPQFYGSPLCNIGTTGFSTSFAAWSKRLSGPKLYIGGISFANGTTNGGYQDPDLFSMTIKAGRKLASSNFGGVMLWDGAYGHITKDAAGLDFIAVAKTALESRSSPNAIPGTGRLIFYISILGSISLSFLAV